MSTPRRFTDPAQVQNLIEQQLACATSLIGIMERERQALLGNAMDALAVACDEKFAAASTMQALGASLEKLNAGPAQMEQLIQLPEGSALATQWKELRALAAQCQSLNLGNGALLDERQTQLRRNQRALRGFQPGMTYGRGGGELAPSERRRIASA